MTRLILTTAGESHGRSVTAVLTGFPAGFPIDLAAVDAMLARRQGGYGRGGRMAIEEDHVEVEAGLLRGRTMGSPLLLRVVNRDHRIDEAPEVTRPRPGHADLAGMMKFSTRNAREVLERSSARETVARVAAGAMAAQLLGEFGVTVAGFVISLGGIRASGVPVEPEELIRRREESPFHCPDLTVTGAMVEAVDAARDRGDTLGGVIEVRASGVVPGLGTNATWDGRLDARLAMAMMSIPAIKGVEIGLGFAAADRPGSEVHDPIVPGEERPGRTRNHAGGLEGGITNGEPLVIRGAMKPLSTLMRGLPTVDVRTGDVATGAEERSDVTAVPAASVVAEAMVALVVADALLKKTGGDSLEEVRRNLEAYLASVKQLFQRP